MEKRSAKRKPVSLEARLICDGLDYPAFIENISEYGLHMVTASKKRIMSFIPEMQLNLKFQSPSGNKTDLYCEIRWVHINKTPIHGLTYRMGTEILEQPPEYMDFFNTLE